MKKILAALLFVSIAFSSNIKDDTYFLGFGGGKIKILSTESTASVNFGYYFYDPNIYKITNRIYLNFNYIDSDADFYITNLKLDWIKSGDIFSPFLGVSVGYLYFDQNNNDYSTNIWGFQGGLMLSLGSVIDIELSASWQKAFEKKNIWNNNIKNVSAGININF